MIKYIGIFLLALLLVGCAGKPKFDVRTQTVAYKDLSTIKAPEGDPAPEGAPPPAANPRIFDPKQAFINLFVGAVKSQKSAALPVVLTCINSTRLVQFG